MVLVILQKLIELLGAVDGVVMVDFCLFRVDLLLCKMTSLSACMLHSSQHHTSSCMLEGVDHVMHERSSGNLQRCAHVVRSCG